MNSARIAEKHAKILRPILEIEKKDLPVSQALEDAAVLSRYATARPAYSLALSLASTEHI